MNFNYNETISCVPDNNIRRNGIVYVIYKCDDNKVFYIGSTFKTLSERVSKHKNLSKRYITNKFYEYVNQFGWEYFNAQVLEYVNFVTRGQLVKREGEYQIFYKPCLNTNL